MGKSIGGLLKTIAPVAGIASDFIPMGGTLKKVLGAVGSLGSGLQQADSAKGFEQAGKGNFANLSGIAGQGQARYNELLPFLRLMQDSASGALQSARQYDPAMDTQRGMQGYDIAARESLNSDIGNASTPFSMRGFTGGSSDQTGKVNNVLGQRAGDRAKTFLNLKLGEQGRKDQALTSAFGKASSLIGASGAATSALGQSADIYQNLGNFNYGQAGQYDPTAAIKNTASSLQGLDLPWMKPRAKPKPAGNQTPTKYDNWNPYENGKALGV